MNARTILTTTLTTALAAAALTIVTPAASQAATSERFDRRTFDSAPVLTDAGWTMSGATAGELGGHLTLSVRASDGAMPAAGECEAADVHAVLSVAPVETFTIDTTGEICSHFLSGTPSLNAYFGAKQVEYDGTHKRARVTDGMISSGTSFLGAQGSVGLTVRW